MFVILFVLNWFRDNNDEDYVEFLLLFYQNEYVNYYIFDVCCGFDLSIDVEDYEYQGDEEL